MKTLYISIAGSICVAVAVGILTMSGTIDMSSLLHIPKTSYHQLLSLPILPRLAISINGTSSVDQFMHFDTRPGQNITLLVNVTTEPRVLPVTLSASPKLGFSKADGVNWQMSPNQINNTSSIVLLHISIGNNVRPAKYPMEIDANTQAIPNVNFTEVAYFTLTVVSPTNITAQNSTSLYAQNNVTLGVNNSNGQIIITGTVYKQFSNPVVLKIKNPKETLIAISQLKPASDGTFSLTFGPSAPL